MGERPDNASETHAQCIEILRELQACYALQIEAEELKSKARIAELELFKAAAELEVAAIRYLTPNNRYDRSREPDMTRIFAFTAEILRKRETGASVERHPKRIGKTPAGPDK